jgi:hypothetical protein
MKFFIAALLLLVGALNAKAAKSNAINEADLPPLVLMGTGRLDCTISSTENGSQVLSLTGGSGVHFDVEVTPILDGVLELKDGRLQGAKGGTGVEGNRSLNYRFTSNLARVKKFTVTGFGALELLKMETKVSVNARRYRQEKGPGTAVSFASEDMDRQGVYIEFRGIFRERESKKRFAFRTILGPPTDGSGQVTPLDSNDNSRIIAKTVVVDIQPRPGGPFTQITTTIRELDEK